MAVTGRVARLAMIGSPASGGQVLDQYALDLPDDLVAEMSELAETIIGTYRAVTESGNQVAATRLCVPDDAAADTLRQTVLDAGVPNVELVTEAEAAAALARSVGADAALLLADDDTVSLTTVGEDSGLPTSTLATMPIGTAGIAAACAAVLQRVPADEAPGRVLLVGQRLDLDSVAAELRSTAPVEVAPDAGYAIARGAAQLVDDFAPASASTQMAPGVGMPQDPTQMAPAAADATQMAPAAADATQMAPAADATQMAPAPADSAAVGPDLAYSQEAEDDPWADEMPMDAVNEFVPEQEDDPDYTTVIAPPPPRMLLMGSALAFVVVSFATLATAVAINVRPTADVRAQPAPAQQADTVPGNYLPPVPHEPDPVALPVSVLTPPPAAPAAPKVRSGTGNQQVNQAPQVAPPAAPPAVPAPPPVEISPGPVPVPVPVPLPVPVPIPPVVWPTLPSPWVPTTPPTTTTAPPTTTTKPPTTTTAPPTTTTAPPTTTTAPPTTTTAPPTTTVAPPTTTVPTHTSTEASVPTIEAPAHTAPAYTPPIEQPATQAPVTQAPVTTVAPQYPSSGGSSSGGSSSSDGGSSSGGLFGGGSGSGGAVTTMPVSP
ncbi:hypothetical protein H7K19_28410 [Mycolicibacterium neworleansense]|nr:hypothetical protein [Mycolicibacterium neworleansense]